MANLAYDFERFETNRVPKQQEQTSPQIRVVGKNNQKAREMRVFTTKCIALILSIMAVAGVMLYNQATLNEMSAEIAAQNQQLNILESERIRLTSEIEGKMSAKSIEEAVAAMGLGRLESYQVECIDLSEGNRIEVPEAESVTLWSRLSGWIDQVKAYLHL